MKMAKRLILIRYWGERGTFAMRTIEHWDRLPREVLVPLFLELELNRMRDPEHSQASLNDGSVCGPEVGTALSKKLDQLTSRNLF